MDDKTARGAFASALRNLGIAKGCERGMYAPLVKRCPIRTGDEVPKRVKQGLDAHQTCACTDSNIVYVDFDNAKTMFSKAREVASKGTDSLVTNHQAEVNYKTALVHEYTHIIMQHVDKGIKFVRANGDKNYPIFALACDIEANRGWGIEKDSDLYQIAVTDDYYPECKEVYGLMNIYRTLKKFYGDEILDDYKSKDDEQKDEGEGEEDDSGQGEADEKREARKKALQRAVPSMESMKEEIEQKSSMMTEEELDKNLEQFDENNPNALGRGEGETPDDVTPYSKLEAQYDADVKRKTERAIEQLKGLVRGSQIKSRVKTYSRQSRKDSPDGLIRKGVKNKKALAPRILVAMDSSGSMCSTEVTPIATSIGTIAKMLGRTKGSYICEHEGHVKNVNPLSKWEDVVKHYYPDGDNDFDEVLEKAIELDVEVVINVGDGYARFYDENVMKTAHQKKIKWVDVQVCGDIDTLKRVIDEDARRHGKNFIGREILKVGGE